MWSLLGTSFVLPLVLVFFWWSFHSGFSSLWLKCFLSANSLFLSLPLIALFSLPPASALSPLAIHPTKVPLHFASQLLSKTVDVCSEGIPHLSKHASILYRQEEPQHFYFVLINTQIPSMTNCGKLFRRVSLVTSGWTRQRKKICFWPCQQVYKVFLYTITNIMSEISKSHHHGWGFVHELVQCYELLQCTIVQFDPNKATKAPTSGSSRSVSKIGITSEPF